jgi:hypothetical protein
LFSLLEPPNQAGIDFTTSYVATTDDGHKEKARLARRTKLTAIHAALRTTSSSNLLDSLLFYLTPLLCLLPDYLTPTFPLSNTMPDSCPGTMDASYTMKLKQQKPFIYIVLSHLPPFRQEKTSQFNIFLHFFFLSNKMML